MSGAWWVGEDDLDEDQQAVVSLPRDGSFLVTGPPGSGKTNLLLLRAQYLYLYGLRNIQIVVFTRTLREFIAAGSSQYGFPASKVVTCREWQCDLLRQHGETWSLPTDFEEQRDYLLRKVSNVTNREGLQDVYDAIFLDESQDYTPAEIALFRRLSKRLFCVADSRQKIYNGEDSIDALSSHVDEIHRLRFHYRNGLKICQLADGIAAPWKDYEPLMNTANYIEKLNPSSVEHIPNTTIKSQAQRIIEKLDTQIKAFPGELFGVICPRKEELLAILQEIQASPLGPETMYLSGRASDSFESNKHVCVCTCHAAKGLEFRGLHLAGCDLLKVFGNNRRMAFTSVTRAKTSLSLYSSGDIHGYLDAALEQFRPVKAKPKMSALFGGGE